jgi:site-specific recombinase XerD
LVVASSEQRTRERLVRTWLGALESARTQEAYGRDVAAFTRWCAANGHDLLRVGVAEVSDYRDDCGDEGVRPATVARRLSALASFYDHAAVARVVGRNPVDHVARPVASPEKAETGLDEQEAAALMTAAQALGPKVFVLVALLLLEGLKLAEALALDVEHLDIEARRMHAEVARRGSAQSIELDRRTARAITAYLAGRDRGPLLVGDSPTQPRELRLTRFGADFLLKRAAAGAGLGTVSANTLRRTHIATSHRDGAAVEAIADRVGHANPRDTRRYLP